MVVGTTLPMRAMLRGVKYVSVLLDQVLKDTPSGVPSAKVCMNTELHSWMLICICIFLNSSLTQPCAILQALELNAIVNEGIANGEVIPLPFKIYQRDEIQAAFRFLTRGEVPFLGVSLHRVLENERGNVWSVYITLMSCS